MSLIVFALASVLPLLVVARIPNIRNVLLLNENSISPPDKYPDSETKGIHFNGWVKVSQNGPSVLQVAAGDRIELECEAVGSPSPVVQWSIGSENMPIYEESNNIEGMNLGKTISRLVIDCALPFHQHVYTCLATTGTKSAVSESTRLVIQAGNLTNILTKCQETRPRIVKWSPILMETRGNEATLPCVAKGSPSPQLYWVDSDDKIISNEDDSRFKVMENGDLLIAKLRWEDMGGYTCVIQNPFGRDSVTTFLYPLKEA